MGGNALKAFGAKRVESTRARAIGATVCAALDKMLADDGFALQSHLIRAYRSKVDYGDLDILLPQEFVDRNGHRPLVERLQGALGGDWPFVEAYPGAPAFHTAIALEEGGSLQVDLMPVPSECFAYAQSFYAWNDLSKLFIILARQMNGLRFGNDGLSRSVKIDGRVLGVVTFTRDFDEALTFLGYDAVRYNQGFDTLEDMFEFAVSNPRFNTSMYQLENRTNRGRGQDKKRVTYQAFLAWMKDRDLPEYDWASDSTDWLELALDHFAGAREQYTALLASKDQSELIKQRYNGEVVASLTGLSRIELGAFMKAFKKHVGEETFTAWLGEATAEQIKTAVQQFHAQYLPISSQESEGLSR